MIREVISDGGSHYRSRDWVAASVTNLPGRNSDSQTQSVRSRPAGS